MPELSAFEVVFAIAVMTAAACLQASIGFGLSMLAAPILALVDPAFVPGPLILASAACTTLILRRDFAHLEYRGVAWAVGGNAVGSVAAAAVLTAVTPRGFAIFFASLVLLGVGISLWGARIAVTPRNSVVAGVLSGFMGTASSVGGPPVALLYQHQPAPWLRANLSAYFLSATVFALAALAWIGRLGGAELRLALLILPGVLLGYALSHRTAPVLDRAGARSVVIVLSGASALSLLMRVLV